MNVMSSLMQVGELLFRSKISEVEITTSRTTITQSAIIKLPRYSKMLIEEGSVYRIKAGDKVIIQLGYNGEFKQQWKGYVSEIKPNAPIELRCEDEMYKYKKDSRSMSWKEITLENLLKWLMPTVKVNCPQMTISNMRIDRATTAAALQKLKEDYGLDIYFRNEELFAGLAYTDGFQLRAQYHLQENVPSVSEQSELEFVEEDQVKIKVKAESILSDNKRIEVELGDPDGEQRTLHFYNIKDKEVLRTMAQEQLKKLKFTGYRGRLTTFGWPVAEFGGTAEIIDGEYPERSRNVVMDSVRTIYNSSGYRHTIDLGIQVS